MKNKFVAAIGFKNNSFLLIKNPDRGWEFPGGEIQVNESSKKAIKREFIEETGYKLSNIRFLEEIDDGYFFLGTVSKNKTSSGEFKSRFFKKLPKNLSFDKTEYRKVINLAKTRTGKKY